MGATVTVSGPKIHSFAIPAGAIRHQCDRPAGHSHYRNDAGDLVEQTEWHRITAFNGLGKTVAEYGSKGMKVSVQGRLHYSKWTDQAGQTRYGVDIYASEVEFLSKAPASTAGGSACPEDDEVPF